MNWVMRGLHWGADRITWGHRPEDDRRTRTIKRVMFIVAFTFVFLNIRSHAHFIADGLWFRTYITLGLTVAIGLVFGLLKTRLNIETIFYIVTYFWLANHVLWHFIEGNPNNFAIFLLILPIGSILVLGTSRSFPHYLGFCALCICIPLLDGSLPYVPTPTDDPFFANGAGLFGSDQKAPNKMFAFVYVLIFGSLVYVSLYIVLQERDRARAQVEALLMNTLPQEIVARLNREDRTVTLQSEPELAEEFPAVTVLFADIVGFTLMSSKKSPAELVTILNDIFTRFDSLADVHGVEKIKTIGDAYMAVSGVPTPVMDHAARVARMALAMQSEIQAFRAETGHDLAIRIGVNTGPVVAGVIGQRRFAYDLWGDTVNLASRMESHGAPSRVQISSETAAMLEDDFDLEMRGAIDVKGKGKVETWWLLGEHT